MKKIVLLFSIVVLVAGVTLATASDKGPEVMKIPATLGEIIFDHAAHVEKVAECVECHHKGTADGKCTNCHKFSSENGVPLRKMAFHDQCKNCHAKTAGPTNCKGCHAMSR